MSTKYLPKYVFTSDKMTKAQHLMIGRNKKKSQIKKFSKRFGPGLLFIV